MFRNIEILPELFQTSPLVLNCGNWETTKSYFKFENWWRETEGFSDRVKIWQTSFDITGRPDYIVAGKLKALKSKLREWSLNTYGKLEREREKNAILNLTIFLWEAG